KHARRGIPSELLPRIFDPFVTTKDVGEGTGLGLAITYGIIQEHGGTIHATNLPSGGARFPNALPLVSSTLAAGAASRSALRAIECAPGRRSGGPEGGAGKRRPPARASGGGAPRAVSK